MNFLMSLVVLLVLIHGFAFSGVALDATTYGGADACVKIKAAIAALPAGGGTVDARGFGGAQACSVDPFNGVDEVELVLGAATYTADVTWKVTTKSSLHGDGEASIIKAKADFGNNPIVSNYTTNPASDGARDVGIRIYDFKIDGNRANNSTATEWSHGVQLNAVDHAWVTNMTVTGVKGSGVNTSYGYPDYETRQSRFVTIEQNHISNVTRNGVDSTGMTDSVVSHNIISGADLHGICLEDNSEDNLIENIVIDANVVQGGGGTSQFTAGVSISCDAGTTRHILVQSNIITGRSNGNGIQWRGVDGLVIRGNMMYDIPQAGIAEVADTTTQSVNIVIDANIIDNPTLQGIAVNKAIPFQITNNKIRSSASNGIQADSMIGGLVVGNVVTDSIEGIQLKNASKNVVANNVSKGNTRGIRMQDSCTDNIVANNVFTDNSSRAIYEVGSTPNRNQYSNNLIRDNGTPQVTITGGSSVEAADFTF